MTSFPTGENEIFQKFVRPTILIEKVKVRCKWSDDGLKFESNRKEGEGGGGRGEAN